jgi:hypothetical protein
MVRDFLRAAISFAGAGIWWFIDKMWGDRVFAALKPRLPEWQIWTMTFDEWLRLLWMYAPLAVFLGLAIFFIRQGSRRMPTIQYAAPVAQSPPTTERRRYNWTIRQAYQYRVSLLGRLPTGDEMFDIFKEFRQEAIDGNITIRGIPLSLPPMLGLEQPHETILPTHWRTMNFYVIVYTLDADDKTAYEAPTEFDGIGKPEQPYYGLMVSEAQVEELWPQPSSASGNSFKPIHEVIAYVAAKLEEQRGDKYFPKTRTAIRQQALDGKLKLRGRVQIEGPEEALAHREVHEDIPPSYWANTTFNVLAVDAEARELYHTYPENSSAWDIRGGKDKKHYASILADWRQVQQLWP